MDPIVISRTIQEFGGVRYYLCGKYFQHKGIRLHLVVWWHHCGLIPRGHHIHHKDDDRSNNVIGNLECLPGAEHLRLHGKKDVARARRLLPLAWVAAAAWHRSKEGQRWHAKHGKSLRGLKRPRVAAVCQHCGKDFMASAALIEYAKFCHPNCKARALRKRRREAKSAVQKS